MIITSALIPGLRISSIFGPALMVAGITGINHYFWDSSLFHALPEGITEQALTLLLINGFFFWLLVKILPGIESEGLISVIIAPIVFTVVGVFIEKYGKTIDWTVVMSEVSRIMSQIRDYVRESFSNTSLGSVLKTP